MYKSHKSKITSFLFLILIISLIATQIAEAQTRLPKQIIDFSYALENKAIQDTIMCNTNSYYSSPVFIWSLPNDYPETSFAQRFENIWFKKLSTVSIYLYEDTSIHNSPQGIDIVFYNYGNDSKPDTVVQRINIPENDIIYYPNPTILDVSTYDLNFENDYFYFIAFEVANLAVDTFLFIVDALDGGSGSPTFAFQDYDDQDGIFTWAELSEIGYYPDMDLLIEAEYCYFPKTLRVPEDFSTIQQAVDSAMDYDTVLVNDGIYSFSGTENIEVTYKHLYIRSVNGPEFTIIEGDGSTPVVALNFLTHPEYSNRLYEEIDGFTFRNFHGGIIRGKFNHILTIKNSIFYSNVLHYGAISCGGVDLIIENCTFAYNLSFGDGLLEITGGNPTIRNSIIYHSGGIGEAIYSIPAATAYPYYDIQNTNIYSSYIVDWTEHILSQAYINGNISEDPLFCDPANGDFHINENSFCNPDHPLNINNTLMGFYGVGCSGCDDTDSDGICDLNDNCLTTYNPSQLDSDFDDIGDECDTCPLDSLNDTDGDGFCFDNDNCPDVANPDQLDSDSDGIGDECDACPSDPTNDADGDGYCLDDDNCTDVYNPSQLDSDNDGIGDECDACPLDSTNDADGDGYCPDIDNCSDVYNPNQLDSDGDGIGDACDACPLDSPDDTDGDGYCSDVDNCPDIYNPYQADASNDGVGDACCCIGIRGNTNGDTNQDVDISDLVVIVDFIFLEGTANCMIEFDVNNDNEVDISDLVYFVSFMFQDGPDPESCY